MIDFHSHILPGIDDGSDCLETSLKMLQMEAQQGIDLVVATPHFYAHHDAPERFLRRREAALAELQEAAANQPELPAIVAGAEVYYFPGISDSDALSDLTIAGTSCVLVEMPQGSWTEAMFQELEGIYTKRGITPIIAHIDRYLQPFKKQMLFNRLARMPVLVQANAAFFLNRTSGFALRMLRKDRIQLLGSDCHSLRSRRPNLGPALSLIEKRLGTDILHRVDAYGRDILENT